MHASAPRITFRQAALGYDGRAVLEGVTFDVARGEVVGLVGPNGAGKTTLVRALCGQARVLAGTIEVDGVDLRALDVRSRARAIAVVPQALPVAFAFTARHFVEMGRHPHLGPLHGPSGHDARIVDEVLELTDTARLQHETVDTLSGGDLQRLTVAQALAQRPRILLLDEATAHLDINHALQVLDLVRRLADEGMTVIAVFHDLDTAARYADRIAIVAQRGVTVPAVPERALEAATIERVFDVRVVVRTEPVTGTVAVVPIVRGADVVRPVRGPVGVVCGSGAAASLLRRLALARIGAHCGALNRGDLDHAVARALNMDLIELPPFAEMDADVEARVMGAYAGCVAVVVSATPFGRANIGNLRAAVTAGVPIVLVGAMTPDRDYAAGEARRLWTEALAVGATAVADEAAVMEVIEDICRAKGSSDG